MTLIKLLDQPATISQWAGMLTMSPSCSPLFAPRLRQPLPELWFVFAREFFASFITMRLAMRECHVNMSQWWCCMVFQSRMVEDLFISSEVRAWYILSKQDACTDEVGICNFLTLHICYIFIWAPVTALSNWCLKQCMVTLSACYFEYRKIHSIFDRKIAGQVRK